MSRDRKLLYQLVIGIENGNISKVAKSRIGKAHQARWLTLASRILRLHCSVPQHLGEYQMIVLERLSIFISKVYFKVRRLIYFTHILNPLSTCAVVHTSRPAKPYLLLIQ